MALAQWIQREGTQKGSLKRARRSRRHRRPGHQRKLGVWVSTNKSHRDKLTP
ncbi:hypothetical protein ACFQ0Q_50730 [Streptomyces aureus]